MSINQIILVFLFLSLSALAGTASAVTGDRVPLLTGCNNGEGDRVCWVNIPTSINETVSGTSTPPSECANVTQIRWFVQSASGTPNTGEELFAMALSAVNSGSTLRISLNNTTCFTLGSNNYPVVEWMSIVPN